MSEGWYEVDETGHVPYVAAELPAGHKVYLDASHNIGAIVLIEQVPALDEAIAAQQESAPGPGGDAPIEQGNAPDNVAGTPVDEGNAPDNVATHPSSAQEVEQASEQDNNDNTETTSQ